MSPEFPTTSGISIVPPASTGEKLIFRVFDHAAPIGYARLRQIKPEHLDQGISCEPFAPSECTAYKLAMIEVSQNYRQQGVGTTLLQSIIHYCQTNNIKRLAGDIKGDTRTLRHWYSSNGFQVDQADHIELLPAISI